VTSAPSTLGCADVFGNQPAAQRAIGMALPIEMSTYTNTIGMS
jgi:hypothetical protein